MHQRFIHENKPNWHMVRVFDADVEVEVRGQSFRSEIREKEHALSDPTRPQPACAPTHGFW